MIRILSGLFMLLVLPATAVAAELIMFEERGCYYCAVWNREIGPVYPKTPEGKYAPLRRTDLHGPLPEGLTLDRKVIYSPTFVLVSDGVEVGRIEGYPGEDFFWGLLSRMVRESQTAPEDAGS